MKLEEGDKELSLLIDIAKLIKKYGPEPFELLAQSILSPKFVQNLSSILMQSSKVAHQLTDEKKPDRTKAKKAPIPKSIIELKDHELEKYRLLSSFFDELVTKTVLPSLKEMQDFAVDYGLHEIRADSRQKAINQLINSLADLSYEQAAQKIQLIRKHGKGDRSLEGWTDIILKKDEKDTP